MAGGGRYIGLGGEAAHAATRTHVIASGGLLVIGTAHLDLCRLEDQLRGRAGRQGDPGRSIFHASLQDDLLKTAAAKLPLPAGGAVIASPVARRVLRAAQKRHESQSFDRRLGLLRFDTIIQQQYDTFYDLRRDIHDQANPLATVKRLRYETIADLMDHYAPAGGVWDIAGLDASIRSVLTLVVVMGASPATDADAANALADRIRAVADRWMQGKIDTIGEATLGDVLRRVTMALVDQLWSEQAERLEHLKRQIGDRHLPRLRVVAEFGIEAFALFKSTMRTFRHEVTAHAMRLGLTAAPASRPMDAVRSPETQETAD
jgi:preprotein translocase subunit SecA